MRLSQGLLVATMGLMLAGCNAAFWGNFIVFGITLGIFVGTLSLGQNTDPATATDSAVTTSHES